MYRMTAGAAARSLSVGSVETPTRRPPSSRRGGLTGGPAPCPAGRARRRTAQLHRLAHRASLGGRSLLTCRWTLRDIQMEDAAVKRCIVVFAFLLSFGLTASQAGSLMLSNPADADWGELITSVHHRCVPSRCGCRGNQTTWCYHDCRRDRHCRCRHGRYVCHFFKLNKLKR